MRALIEALEPFEQFISSAMHSAAIMVFNLATFSSSWAGDASSGNRLWTAGWSLSHTIVMIFIARSNHLGQILLRNQMLLPALFLNLNTAQGFA